MSSFKEMLATDNQRVFLNVQEFASLRTVVYEGQSFVDIPVVLSGLREDERRQNAADHAQGLFLVKTLLQCALVDLGGVQPQKGARLKINNQEGGGGFFREFYITEAVCEFGLLRLELEDMNERNRWNWQ